MWTFCETHKRVIAVFAVSYRSTTSLVMRQGFGTGTLVQYCDFIAIVFRLVQNRNLRMVVPVVKRRCLVLRATRQTLSTYVYHGDGVKRENISAKQPLNLVLLFIVKRTFTFPMSRASYRVESLMGTWGDAGRG